MNVIVISESDLHPPSAPLVPTGVAALPDSSNFGRKTCAKCGAENCTLFCNGCKLTGIGNVREFYCSKACQALHWKATHRNICYARRKLFRAAEIFDEIWSFFEHNAYQMNAKFLGVKDNVVSITYHRPNDGPDARGWTGQHLLAAFPGDIFPPGTDEAIQKAVLADSACGEILIAGMKLIEALLQPFCTSIDVIDILAKDPALVVEPKGIPVMKDHSALCLGLPNEFYIFDIAGAQFGWTERIYTWSNYYNFRVHSACNINPLNRALQGSAVATMLASSDPQSLAKAGQKLRQDIVNKTVGLVSTVFANTDGGVQAFMSAPEDVFATARQQCLTLAMAEISGAVRKLKETGIGRVYFNTDFDLRVVMEEKHKTKAIWLSEKEVEAQHGRVRGLKTSWILKSKAAKRSDK